MRGPILRALERLRGSPAADAPAGAVAERVCLAAGEDIGAKYARCDPPVPGKVPAITRDKAKELIADGIREILRTRDDGTPKTTYGRVCVTIGLDEDSDALRDAKEERSLLGIDKAFNLLLVDPHSLDPLFNYFGKALVDKNPRPVDWDALGIAAVELGAGIMRAKSKGHVSHLDLPALKALARRVLALGQGAG